MSHYLNTHDVLDARRQEALKSKGEGPRTFVVGPTGASCACLWTSSAWLGCMRGFRVVIGGC
jgi:hypothetical protein